MEEARRSSTVGPATGDPSVRTVTGPEALAGVPERPPFLLEVSADGDTVVVAMTGEVDMATTPALREALVAAVDRGCRSVRVDLAGVTFMDSSGLSALVAGLRELRAQGGSMAMVNARPPVLRVFEISGFSTVAGL